LINLALINIAPGGEPVRHRIETAYLCSKPPAISIDRGTGALA
jgi:hypothetical protein